MKDREYDIVIILFIIFLCSTIIFSIFKIGYVHGIEYANKNPDFTKIEFNEKTYPLLKERCEQLREVEKIVDVVIGVIEVESKKPKKGEE